MNLDDLLNEMSEKIRNRDLSDENKYGITMQELQAINKKIEELGWMN